ncbi:MAG: nucleotidyltransferase domain-containing protein [Clostridiales bacterium]|nr:nucleotidyltransferase domain-containing protein [Clostridiales bacterium]
MRRKSGNLPGDMLYLKFKKEGYMMEHDGILTLERISEIVRPIALKYNINEIYLFGSYARGEATNESDLDFLVFGGNQFRLTMIFAVAEELREAFGKDVDVFEINEVNRESAFYQTIMKERLLVA